MSQLIERHDGFAYDYRMRCQCGGVVAVTADTYFRESSVEALVPGTHCGEDVDFGPAVAALRDDSDPALIDENLNRFAWYHTSTWRDWPSSDHTEVAVSTARITARQFHVDEEGMVTRATTQALHVGTYEAAIENVLRRMHDQGDALSQFFLHRVELRIQSSRINHAYRDENLEEAAQLRISDLDRDDVDAVRYLNAWEAMGTLSLAIRPGCVAAVQSLSIPLPDVTLAASPRLAARLVALDARHQELTDARAQLSGDGPSGPRPRRVRSAPSQSLLDNRIEQIEHRSYDLWRDVDAALLEAHLGEVSSVVASDFRDALATWRRGSECDDVHTYTDRFAAMASLLTRAPDVKKHAALQDRRRAHL
ncbi:MAG TPA: hypothetical protein VGJ03_06380 [Acidimicrobiales bacterium]